MFLLLGLFLTSFHGMADLRLLGDEEWLVREQAQQRLQQLGPVALPLFHLGRLSADGETSRRAADLYRVTWEPFRQRELTLQALGLIYGSPNPFEQETWDDLWLSEAAAQRAWGDPELLLRVSLLARLLGLLRDEVLVWDPGVTPNRLYIVDVWGAINILRHRARGLPDPAPWQLN